jgi:hypothetical protein
MVAQAVSETQELQAVTEALLLIDGGLSTVQHRELVSSDEVADLLLDLRMLLAPLTTAVLEDDEVAVSAN